MKTITSLPLLAILISSAVVGAAPTGSTPLPQASVAQTQQQRSDRVVGFWTSSSGADITLAYTGQPGSLWIQVYPRPGRVDPRLDYTAQWLGSDRFTYTDRSGARVEGRISASGAIIELKGADGWRATWRRKR